MRLVKVLVVEDEDKKYEDIKIEIETFFHRNTDIIHVKTFSECTTKILTQEYDLIIVDLLLPRRLSDTPVDVSEEMIDYINESTKNKLTTIVAISRFDNLVDSRREIFTRSGIFLINYSDANYWKSCLHVCMQKVNFTTVYDFVIICALELERDALAAVHDSGFHYREELISLNGLDAREVDIGKLRGVCIKPPRMGLVDASIITTQALYQLRPKLICMAGICGGFSNEVSLGTLIVADSTWEHQAGKWKGEDFSPRGDHSPLKNETRLILSQMLSGDPNLLKLASKPHEVQVPKEKACLAHLTSGSSVIASTNHSETIKKQHGKVAGVDMEAFAVYRAVELSGQPTISFVAKTVVDHADEAKQSELQLAGAILSARFVIKAIAKLLEHNN